MMTGFNNRFEQQWPGGYCENNVVYSQQIGITLNQVVIAGIEPFADPKGVALEIGCGAGYWVKNHLLPRFKTVIGLDVIRHEWARKDIEDDRFTYIQVPVSDWTCHGVEDESVDFVWSFGCFCHLPLLGIPRYVQSAFRVLRPGKNAVMSFSECGRRPGGTPPDQERMHAPNWAMNDLENTKRMCAEAGFVNFTDLFPNSKDLIVWVQKPSIP